ncbi:VOC family protein [Candidatus Fukatsuia symbiotica]|uniref:VOC family protein n=1 Tax=Candidatus Fukatsuia symbiotica TaxID=1878942 RepID=UPI0020B1177E|nr:VOC family protein [Candidatus Fukatsuia symbiotica]MEA9446107.1 VOC family protein [Candidatus Fukatsuia symbiotica]
MIKYLHTMVRVSNLDESLDFYCNKLGLVEVKRTEHEQGRFTLIFLAAPGDLNKIEISHGPMLELTYNWDTQTYLEGRYFGHLAYCVDNIYETCQRLKDTGVVINRPPRDGYMAFIRSPDNISIEFLQKGERLPKQEPWASAPNIGHW